jgi:hypothetical protein
VCCANVNVGDLGTFDRNSGASLAPAMLCTTHLQFNVPASVIFPGDFPIQVKPSESLYPLGQDTT